MRQAVPQIAPESQVDQHPAPLTPRGLPTGKSRFALHRPPEGRRARIPTQYSALRPEHAVSHAHHARQAGNVVYADDRRAAGDGEGDGRGRAFPAVLRLDAQDATDEALPRRADDDGQVERAQAAQLAQESEAEP